MRKLTDRQKIEIVEKYKAGFSLRKIAIEYNVSKTSIFSILKIRGIKRD
jgi:predicted DNA-binding protein YlxM (UPF0122 family)